MSGRPGGWSVIATPADDLQRAWERAANERREHHRACRICRPRARCFLFDRLLQDEMRAWHAWQGATEREYRDGAQ